MNFQESFLKAQGKTPSKDNLTDAGEIRLYWMEYGDPPSESGYGYGWAGTFTDRVWLSEKQWITQTEYIKTREELVGEIWKVIEAHPDIFPMDASELKRRVVSDPRYHHFKPKGHCAMVGWPDTTKRGLTEEELVAVHELLEKKILR